MVGDIKVHASISPKEQGCQKELATALQWLLGVSAASYLVKASKSDKRLRSYGHLKICMVSDHFGLYMDVFMQAPTCHHADAYSK